MDRENLDSTAQQNGIFVRSKEGKILPVERLKYETSNSNLTFSTYIFRDISERKEIESLNATLEEQARTHTAQIEATNVELRDAKGVAETVNNAKSRFLAAASHDLRQPLTALGLYVEVLKMSPGRPADKLVANMSNCVATLSELLADLLDISKLEAGVVTSNVSDFSISELMTSLIAVHALAAQCKGLKLRWRPSPLYARTDRVLLTRMLGNLLANAVGYTKHGGVFIGCRRHAGKTWIEVWDSGIGIPKDKAEEIFEEYRQLNPNQKRHGGSATDNGPAGSGLGLAIVAKTAALLGLTLRVKSVLGKGAMFAVELPLGEADPTPEQAAVALDAQCTGLRIALVDDNAAVLDAMCSALRGLGHQVLAADSGQALMRLLGSAAPDMLIADYRLFDGETGFDVIALARQAFGDKLPAAIITGDTDPAILRSMAAHGITVLHKPLQMAVLQALLNCATEHGQP